MSAQQQTATAVQATSACPHPEAVGTRWSYPISAERQRELQGYLDRWAAETDHGDRMGPFNKGPGYNGVPLTGADVFWLAEQSLHYPLSQAPEVHLPNLHLQGADMRGAHLEGANLRGAHLERARLDEAHLERAHLDEAYLGGEGVYERASLRDAHLEGASLRNVHTGTTTPQAGKEAAGKSCAALTKW